MALQATPEEHQTALCLIEQLRACSSVLADTIEGTIYEFGFGMPAGGRNDQSMQLFKRAAQRGDPSAQCLLGVLIGRTAGFGKDPTEESWYRHAVDQGHVHARFNWGGCLEAAGKLSEAIEHYKIASALGDTDAVISLANRYNRGVGVTRDPYEATKLFRIAAEQGDPESLVSLGEGYRLGTGTPVDLQQAVKCYKLAADQDHTDALYILGWCLYAGVGCPKDIYAAFGLFTRASTLGHKAAKKSLAACYALGKGTETDLRKAFSLLEEVQDKEACKFRVVGPDTKTASIQRAPGVAVARR